MKLLKILVVVAWATLSAVCATAAPTKVDDLLTKRTFLLYIEGQKVEDLVVGARAKITLIPIDDSLMNAMEGDLSDLSHTVVWRLSDASNVRAKKLFPVLVLAEAFQSFHFEPTDLAVDGHPLTSDQVFTNLDGQTIGDIEPGEQAAFVIGLSRKIAAPGKTVAFSVGPWKTEFAIPRR